MRFPPVVFHGLGNRYDAGHSAALRRARRGYARHRLVPKGLAAFGTWENIDVQNSELKNMHQWRNRP